MIQHLTDVDFDASTSQFDSQKLINEPAHLTRNSTLCTNLVFISHPNLVMESDVHSSLHPNCHHQTVFAKLDFRVFHAVILKREIWHYNKDNTDLIRGSIHGLS